MIQKTNELDLEIEQLEHLIDRAADGLLSFYDRTQKGFRRSTLQAPGTHSATTTARALFALAEYVRFLQERGAEQDRKRLKTMSRVLVQSTAEWVLGLADPGRREEIRASSDNKQNHFTDSHLLMAMALVPRLHAVYEKQLDHDVHALEESGELMRSQLTKHLAKFRGGKIHDGDPATHDFVTLHALRAIDAFAAVHGSQPLSRSTLAQLRARIEHDVLAKLGYRSARVEAEFDPAELLFTTALLERCKTPNWEKLLHRAVEVVVEDQTSDGAWLGSRVVAYEKRGLLHVASYEVGPDA